MLSFIIATIKKPILGMDLLHKFEMRINCRERCLEHDKMFTQFTWTSKNPVGVNIGRRQSTHIYKILDDFPEIVTLRWRGSTRYMGWSAK